MSSATTKAGTSNETPVMENNSENSNNGSMQIEPPPSWLNERFIEDALKSEHGESIKVICVDIKPAVISGENYACVVYRCAVQTIAHGSINVIAKCIPAHEMRDRMVRQIGLMSREIDMYKNVLPLLKGPHQKPSVPKCYFAHMDDSYGVLVFADLCSQGFRLRPRRLGLDKHHCNLAITELAHFHGASMALRVRNPNLFKSLILDEYEDKMFDNENAVMFGKFMESVISGLAEAVREQLPYRFRSIADVMEKMAPNTFENIGAIIRSGHPKTASNVEKNIFVLTHGDYWCNNMMFKYFEGYEDPEACTMFDFQISRIGKPVLDLLYMLYTSTEQSVRKENKDIFLRLYLDEYRKAMLDREITPESCPFYQTVDEIKEDMRKHALFGFYMASVVMPLVIAGSEEVPSFDDMTEEKMKNMTAESNPTKQLFKGPLFCSRFQGLLEDFDDMGLFANYENTITF